MLPTSSAISNKITSTENAVCYKEINLGYQNPTTKLYRSDCTVHERTFESTFGYSFVYYFVGQCFVFFGFASSEGCCGNQLWAAPESLVSQVVKNLSHYLPLKIILVIIIVYRRAKAPKQCSCLGLSCAIILVFSFIMNGFMYILYLFSFTSFMSHCFYLIIILVHIYFRFRWCSLVGN